MTWNYRILRHPDTTDTFYYAIHEVYYEDGKETTYTEEPVTFTGDSPEGVVRALEMALRDAKRHPVYIPE